MTTDEHRLAQIGEKKSVYADFQELNPVTEKIIGCAFTVSNTLGAGFLEKVYENALALEIQKTGLKVLQQHPIQVWYDGVVVGEYFVDLLVQDKVVVEIKAVKAFDEAHWSQCLNYLKATGLRLCLLLNFGKPRLEIKRIAL